MDAVQSVAEEATTIAVAHPSHARHATAAGGLTFGQRAFDIGLTLLILPFAVIVGLLTALAVFLDSPGSVLYRSSRVGRDGVEFQMLKFRKMLRSATGISLTLHADERFTPVGQFLAMTKLDELPQLWNVLKGEMRLVGPRPETPEFVAAYPDAYREILRVTPGITGPAALECSGEGHLLRTHPDPVAFYLESLMPRKIGIDVAYARGHSMRTDLYVLVRTFFVPVNRLVRRVARSGRAHRVRALCLTVAALMVLATFAITGASQV